MPALMRLMTGQRRLLGGALMLWGLALPACQPRHEAAGANEPPPVGHYEGSIALAGQPELRAALDIRHPSLGHYEAEFTVPTASTLSFVADTMVFNNNQLRLVRPARPGLTLVLTLEGDFWRGSLGLDSTKAATILVKRGVPTPSTYRVGQVPQPTGAAWLFAPSDAETPGAALVLLPDTETQTAAALWADALARQGIIVLVLPAADSATAATETPRLQAALQLLRGTAGADTVNVGAWAAGARAATLAQVLATAGGPHVAFVIAQNTVIDAAGRTALRELRRRKLPVLGLYGGAATQRAAAMRNALGGRRGATVRTYRTAGADLLITNGLNTHFGPGLPGDVVTWLRER